MSGSLLQLICKLPYLFFPLDIQDAVCIVEQAQMQKVYESRLESRVRDYGSRNRDFFLRRLRTRQSAPDDRSREIIECSNWYLSHRLRASESSCEGQHDKGNFRHISTSFGSSGRRNANLIPAPGKMLFCLTVVVVYRK